MKNVLHAAHLKIIAWVFQNDKKNNNEAFPTIQNLKERT
jgi:hypothetical protein